MHFFHTLKKDYDQGTQLSLKIKDDVIMIRDDLSTQIFNTRTTLWNHVDC